ncbi:hypothetical protein Hypma_014721 [Hypsizygus marmoreus]|uniref:Uncharacterized protein n=1 Tax=Hypsizygus marmoreus TaxID=39966 RepID=A0A369JFY3_HYPMA|nr:hypothetical protein Hypma_014721 [Hypsizygus marmoreus]
MSLTSYTSSSLSQTSKGPLVHDISSSCTPPIIDGGSFAFAKIKGDVCLVQVSFATPASALTTVDVKIFRHEFITIFRHTETKTIHPSDIHIIEPIDDHHTRYEEENGTVFLAKELMCRMRKNAERIGWRQSRASRFSTQFARQ